MAQNEEELPVLNDVIRTGDKSVIRSTRTKLTRAKPGGKNQGDSESRDRPQFEFPTHLQSVAVNLAGSGEIPPFKYSSNIEYRIHQIIDKHMLALKKEFRNLFDAT